MIDIPAYMVNPLATRTYVGDRACQRCDGFGWIGTARASQFADLLKLERFRH